MSMSPTSTRPAHRTRSKVSALVVATLIALIALLALASSRAQAQAQATLAGDPPIAPFTNFYIATGTVLVDVGKINAHFTPANGFFAISNDAYSLGGGFTIPVGKLTIGGQYHYFDLGIESSPKGKTDRMTAKFAMVDVGFNFFTFWHWNMYGSFGVGVGSNTLTFRDRNGGPTVSETVDPTFDEILDSPGLKSELTGTFFIIEPAIGLDYLVLANTNSHMGFTIGFRVATAITPNRTTWKYKGRDVFGSPDAGPAGAQIRLQFGIGGFRLASRSPR